MINVKNGELTLQPVLITHTVEESEHPSTNVESEATYSLRRVQRQKNRPFQ